MSDKQLENKAVDIKGKKYVLVSDRVLYFNDHHENGAIVTEKLEASDRVEFKATVWPDVDRPLRMFTGHSQAVWGDGYINKTSALENAETSAVGRALALMGIGVIESIASADEINKAEQQHSAKPMAYATAKQIDWMRGEAEKVTGLTDNEGIDKWLATLLTIPPQKVPVYKVKDAVELIKSKQPALDDIDEVVTDILDGPINLDNVPY